jgi:hypothetical protein
MKKAKRPKESSAAAPERPVIQACALLAMAGLSIYVLYEAMDTFVHGLGMLYGLTVYEPDPVDRIFLFWFGGLGLMATIGITLGLSLLLGGRVKTTVRAAFPPIAVALLTLTVMLSAKFLVLNDSPTMDDENVYHFTAQLLLHGRLSLPVALPQQFLAGRWGVNDRDNRLYPMYSHGWPALLAVGYAIHLPWLISPLIAMGIVLLAADFARRVFGVSTARLTVLLFLASPFFVLTGATDLAPPTAALGLMLVVVSMHRYFEDQRARWLWLAGLGAGWVFQARPLNAVAMVTPFFAYWLCHLWKSHGVSLRLASRVVALLTPLAVSIGLYLTANYFMTGSPLIPAYAKELASRGVSSGSPLGFGINYPLSASGTGVHTVGQGILNSAFNLIRLNTWLLGWPLSLLLPLAAPFNLWTRLSLIALGLEAMLYTTFFNPGLCATGPTYFFDSGVLLLVLAAAGICRFGAWYRTQPMAGRAPRLQGALVAAIVVVNVTMFAPIHVRSLISMTEGTSLLPRTLEKEGVRHAVVFVRNVQGPWKADVPYKSYAYHPRSNASFDDDVVLLNDLGPEQDKVALRLYFQGRRGYQYSVDDDWKPRVRTLE